MVVIFVDAFETMILLVRRGQALLSARADLLSLGVAPVASRGATISGRPAPPGFPEHFRPLVAPGPGDRLGGGIDFQLLLSCTGRSARPFPFAHEADNTFIAYFCISSSGTTFFTLGYGDLVPTGTWGRALSVAEAGIGFGFLAVMISYLPVLYQAFSRREVTISMLDARAGSPPTAGEFLRRIGEAPCPAARRFVGRTLLTDWERWAAEVLESHLSYPVLSYYRSQHDNQSWLATLTMILDTSSLADCRRGRIRRISGAADLRHGPACGGRPGAGVRQAH